jgi:carboxynorspermidine decarboxylase
MILETPYYLVDESRLLKNLKKIRYLRSISNTKFLLALKCFSTWSVFNLISQYMDGTTSSSLYEARLGYETFGKEVHAYSVAFSTKEIDELKEFSTKIIFNSISQLKNFHHKASNLDIGVRINPQISYSEYELADPARKYSRLGVVDFDSILQALHLINGAMFHYNCENANFDNFSSTLDSIANNYAPVLTALDWVSLGGGIYFTLEEYPLEKFGKKLKKFSEQFDLQVYLEPGEAVITDCGFLVTQVLDIVHNEIDIAIVDSSIEAHMLDLLTYGQQAKIQNAHQGGYKYMVAGKSCLAGDIFGTFHFKTPLKTGDIIHIADAAGYTMVKKNWFNALKMPSIVIKRIDHSYDVIKVFNYKDFKNSLS